MAKTILLVTLAALAVPTAAFGQPDDTPAVEQQTECGLLSGFASGYYEEMEPDSAKRYLSESFSYLMWAQATYDQGFAAYESYLNGRVEVFERNYSLEALENLSEEEFEADLTQKLSVCDKMKQAEPAAFKAAEAEARKFYPEEVSPQE